MKYLAAGIALVLLTACGDEEQTHTKPTAEQRADNPLLKVQDDSVQRAENAVKQAMEQQKKTLDQ